MYVIILDYSSNNVIGFNDMGNISLKKAKVRTTTQLKKQGYVSLIRYEHAATRYPWYTLGDCPYWVLRGKKFRYYQHLRTDRLITAHLIPKVCPKAEDQQGLEIMMQPTQEIIFE